MRKMLVQNLTAISVAVLCLAVLPAQVGAHESQGKSAKAVQAGKERLVLMPLRVSEENKNMQAAMETALVQGLQPKYEVFQGEQVAQKAREIFLKESRDMSKRDCNEIRCLQGIAEAFQAELIATANVTKIEGGYLLALNVQNIFDNKAVYSNSLPCRNCDAFQVIEKLKILGNESLVATGQHADTVPASPENGNAGAAEDSLWEEVRQSNKVADYRTYLVQYPRGRFSALAEGRVNLLEEQSARDLSQQEKNAWSDANDTATEAGYQGYLKRYPQGLYVVQAQARIKKFQEAQHKAEGETKPGKVFRDCPECPEMVVIPAGDFNMGANNGDGDEQPVHRVSIAKIFAMGKTEVTQGQWRALMATTAVATKGRGESGLIGLVGKLKDVLPIRKRDVTEGHWNAIMETSPEYFKNCGDDCTREQKRAFRESSAGSNAESGEGQGIIIVDNNPSYFKNCGDDCPVEQVSWADAQKYIQKLIAKTGKQYRLPSEAEWEYACRGGTHNEYCGSDSVESVAWYGAYSNPPGNSGRVTHAVATLRANGFGLFDMSGNVWEWVEDNYHASYNAAPADGSAWLGETVRHALRGGAWSSKAQEVSAAQRSKYEPTNRGSVGFRVVRVLP